MGTQPYWLPIDLVRTSVLKLGVEAMERVDDRTEKGVAVMRDGAIMGMIPMSHQAPNGGPSFY